MIVWRISDYADLLGLGGRKYSGRWHTVGRPIVYCAEHPALAILEALVHFDRSDMPGNYQLLTIDLPDETIEWYLPGDASLTDLDSTQAYGNSWLSSGDSVALRVPSVVAPHSYNYLLNPSHPDIAGVRILAAERWPFDSRLIA